MSKIFSIAVAGDCFPNARFYADGAPISAGFARTLDLLAPADLRFANFEMPLSTRGQPLEKLAAIRAHPEVAADVAEVGFDVVSLANNHAFDYGPEALADTIGALARIGVKHLGAGMSLTEAARPLVVERDGVRVGFAAFSCLVAAGAAAAADRGGVAPIHVRSGYEVNPYWEIEEPGEPLMVTIRTRADEDDQAFAEDVVRRLRDEVDLLFASIHWGYGASDELAEYQQPLGHALLDAGADAIFGNHVHAVQGIELYDGKPILYSPGTFIGRQIPVDASEAGELMQRILAMMSPDGYVGRLAFAEDGSCSVALVPTSIDENGLPLLAEGAVHERIVERIVAHSSRLGTELVLEDGTLVPRATSRA
jgi:poly-gamma-glutamate capsule biosynthesis protein CapA/YwtB (metallophosphatase superfamily)